MAFLQPWQNRCGCSIQPALTTVDDSAVWQPAECLWILRQSIVMRGVNQPHSPCFTAVVAGPVLLAIAAAAVVLCCRAAPHGAERRAVIPAAACCSPAMVVSTQAQLAAPALPIKLLEVVEAGTLLAEPACDLGTCHMVCNSWNCANWGYSLTCRVLPGRTLKSCCVKASTAAHT